MRIKAEDLVEMLKKMDEVEDKAGIAFGSSSEEDLQIALEKMRELRSMLYSALASEQEAQAVPCPVVYPVIAPYREVPWWEMTKVTCVADGTGGKSWDSGTSSSATEG